MLLAGKQTTKEEEEKKMWKKTKVRVLTQATPRGPGESRCLVVGTVSLIFPPRCYVLASARLCCGRRIQGI